MNLKHHKLKETNAWGTELKDFGAKLVLSWFYALGFSGDTQQKEVVNVFLWWPNLHIRLASFCVCVCVCVHAC